MPDKPVAELSGVELCEEAAKGMGWEPDEQQVPRHAKRFLDRAMDRWRYVEKGGGPFDCDAFRPDIDGNHLAEIIAESERRKWLLWVTPLYDHTERRFYAHSITVIGFEDKSIRGHGVDKSWSVAHLWAFVAACRSQGIDQPKGSKP